jgi:hypothetical protein
MTDAIKPPWAISIWANSDHIFAELPAIGGQTQHLVKFPNDVTGFRKLLVLAKSRDIKSQLGTKGDPTQYQLDKVTYDPSMVRRPKEKVKFSAAQRIGARDILRKMGLI